MKFIFKETKLTDGSTVQDVQLIANGQSGIGITAKPICIFSCTSERDALSFLNGLESLMEKHTLERMEEQPENAIELSYDRKWWEREAK